MKASTTYTLPFAQANLIKNCINGHKKSQRILYDTFYDKMFSTCYKYIKDEAQTEDILQEAFIKLFKKLPTYKNEGSFDGWVRKIFVNTALAYLRDKKDTLTVFQPLEKFSVWKNEDALHNLYEKDIIKISMKLETGFYTVFDLYTYKGYSHKEIALLLGIKEGTSKSQLSRAKAKLRGMILNQPAVDSLCA
jgi:RNA polymerase sigma factor (sigma-70 family)